MKKQDNQNSEAIILTAELLENYGFVGVIHSTQDGDVKYWSYNIAFDIEQPLKSGEMFFFCANEYVQIKYLHQLQNLCLALTGEELEIKL